LARIGNDHLSCGHMTPFYWGSRGKGPGAGFRGRGAPGPPPRYGKLPRSARTRKLLVNKEHFWSARQRANWAGASLLKINQNDWKQRPAARGGRSRRKKLGRIWARRCWRPAIAIPADPSAEPCVRRGPARPIEVAQTVMGARWLADCRYRRGLANVLRGNRRPVGGGEPGGPALDDRPAHIRNTVFTCSTNMAIARDRPTRIFMIYGQGVGAFDKTAWGRRGACCTLGRRALERKTLWPTKGDISGCPRMLGEGRDLGRT